jgi:hypothetical protein
MNNIPFSTFDMSEDEAEIMLELYNGLKRLYSTEVDPDFTLDIKSFDVFSHDEVNDYGPVFRITANGRTFYLNFIEVAYKTGGGKYSSSSHIEYQTWGSIELKNDFGHILIKPETFLDKVYDFINPMDVDFDDDKEFSKKFLVVANDKLKAQLQLTQKLRDCIMGIELNEFVIEIMGNRWIIGNKKVVTAGSVFPFAKFLEKVCHTLL